MDPLEFSLYWWFQNLEIRELEATLHLKKLILVESIPKTRSTDWYMAGLLDGHLRRCDIRILSGFNVAVKVNKGLEEIKLTSSLYVMWSD